MTDESPCCPKPKCASLNLAPRVRLGGYRCKQCGWTGDRPATRKPNGDGGPRVGLSGVLDDMDPDEVPP